MPRAPVAPTVLLKVTVFDPALIVRFGLLVPFKVPEKVRDPVVSVMGDAVIWTGAGKEREVLFVVMLAPKLIELGVLAKEMLFAKIAPVIDKAPVVCSVTVPKSLSAVPMPGIERDALPGLKVRF